MIEVPLGALKKNKKTFAGLKSLLIFAVPIRENGKRRRGV